MSKDFTQEELYEAFQEAGKLLNDDTPSNAFPYHPHLQTEKFKEWAHQERLKDYTQSLFDLLYGDPADE